MTVSSIKVKIVRRPMLKLKVLPKFPANVEASGFLTVGKAAGKYTFGADYSKLSTPDTFDPNFKVFAVQDTGDGSFANINVARLLSVAGTVPINKGGTGQVTATSAFDALSPTTTRGDIIARGASSNGRLLLGTSGYALLSNGTDLAWTGFLQSGTGAVTRTWQDKARDFISVRDFGVAGDGTTDDTSAIQAAENALIAGQTLYWPKGRYLTSAPITKGPASWVGAGRDAAVIVAKTGWNFSNLTGLVTGTARSHLSVVGLGFDLSGGVFASGVGLPGNVYWALNFSSSDHFAILDCAFVGLKAQTIGVSTDGCNNFDICRNYFNMPTQSGAFNQAINTSNSAGSSNNFLISDNVLEGTAISLASSNGVVSRNRITGWKYGSGVTVNPVLLTNVSVLDNYIQGGAGLDSNGAYPGGIEYWGFYGVIAGNVCIGNASDGISVASRDNVVNSNVCMNNGQQAAAHGNGIKLGSKDATYNASNCVVSGNRCTDTQGTQTQEYGIAQVVLSGGNQTVFLDISNNSLLGNKLGALNGTSDRLSFNGPVVWGSASFTPGTLAPQANTAASLSVPGARLGDVVQASFDQVLIHVWLHAYVTGNDAVNVQFTNSDIVNATLGAGTVRVRCTKPPGYAAY